MVRFVRDRRTELQQLPTALLSVSLSQAGAQDTSAPPDRRSQAAGDVKSMLTAFLAETRWHPTLAFFAPKNVTIPVAFSAFADEVFQAQGSGRSGPIPISSITRNTTRAAILAPGSSRGFTRRMFARASDHCGQTRRSRPRDPLNQQP